MTDAKPILLTGGSGFLGSHVAEQLSKRGRAVRALVRKTSDTTFLETLEHVELTEGTVRDPDSLHRAAKGVDTIIHVAGLIKAKTPEDFHRTNAGGTEALLEAASRAGVRRFVLVSSLAVAGPSEDGTPVKPDAPPRPVTHYGRSKLAGENAARARKNDLEIVILRPPTVYGPRDPEVLTFFKAVKSGVLPTVVSSDSTLSMIYGPDCAAACIAAVEADVPSGSTFFVDDGKQYRFQDLVEAIEQAIDRRAFLRFPLPGAIVRTAALATETYGRVTGRAVMFTRDKCNELLAPHWVCDGSATPEALGWSPEVHVNEGIRRTGAWYKDAGWL